jgi:glycerol-3-phosphate dehydrogenase (NAD(P)+)
MTTPVAIVGAGVMGTALAYPLADNGHEVRLVGAPLDGDIITSCRERRYHPTLKRELPAGVQPYFAEEISQALTGVEVIVSGVSSPGVHWVGRAIGPYVQPGQAIIGVTKGLEAAENGELLVMPDVLAAELPAGVRGRLSQAAIGGPCIAGELAGRRPSGVIFGARDSHVAERLAAIFRAPYYHVWTTTDLVGLEICAALKNVYAVGVGLANGLLERAGGPDAAEAYMHNLAAAIFAQSCAELDYLLRMVGGEPAFAYGLPGAGDLYVTCQRGRNVRLGRLLGLGHSLAEARDLMAGETVESVFTVQAVGQALPRMAARGRVALENLPLLQMLVNTIVHGRPIDVPLDSFKFG